MSEKTSYDNIKTSDEIQKFESSRGEAVGNLESPPVGTNVVTSNSVQNTSTKTVINAEPHSETKNISSQVNTNDSVAVQAGEACKNDVKQLNTNDSSGTVEAFEVCKNAVGFLGSIIRGKRHFKNVYEFLFLIFLTYVFFQYFSNGKLGIDEKVKPRSGWSYKLFYCVSIAASATLRCLIQDFVRETLL